jgi:hypothetical protein
MPNLIIEKNVKGADYANPNVNLQWLKQNGMRYVCRYIDGTAATQHPTWKVLTKAERSRIAKAGLACVLVFEVAVTNPLKGAAQGTEDGKAACRDAYFLGYHPACPIVIAVDTDVTAGNIKAVEAYVRAFAKACAPYPVGVYGDYDIIDRCQDVSKLNWQANAWGWSALRVFGKWLKRNHKAAHVLQQAQTATAVGVIDPAVTVRPFTAWLPPLG